METKVEEKVKVGSVYICSEEYFTKMSEENEKLKEQINEKESEILRLRSLLQDAKGDLSKIQDYITKYILM